MAEKEFCDTTEQFIIWKLKNDKNRAENRIMATQACVKIAVDFLKQEKRVTFIGYGLKSTTHFNTMVAKLLEPEFISQITLYSLKYKKGALNTYPRNDQFLRGIGGDIIICDVYSLDRDLLLLMASLAPTSAIFRCVCDEMPIQLDVKIIE